MRHKGSEDYYREDRNRELWKAYKDVIWNGGCKDLNTSMQMIVNRPTTRFFVTEERAAVVVSSLLRGGNLDSLSPTKQEMYAEIFRRVYDLLPYRAGIKLQTVVKEVLEQPAPKFYLTPKSATVIIHKIKKALWKK